MNCRHAPPAHVPGQEQSKGRFLLELASCLRVRGGGAHWGETRGRPGCPGSPGGGKAPRPHSLPCGRPALPSLVPGGCHFRFSNTGSGLSCPCRCHRGG